LYVYFDPSLNNSGLHDSGWTDNDALLANDSNIASALVAAPAFTETTNGYLGSSDGLTDLRKTQQLSHYQRATNGNVVQVGRLAWPSGANRTASFTLSLGFGRDAGVALKGARASLASGFAKVQHDYEAGWRRYIMSLPRFEPALQPQLNVAAMVLHALEDKTYRGATIAAPAIPWGGGPNANEPNISG